MTFTVVTVIRDYDLADGNQPTGWVVFTLDRPMVNAGHTIVTSPVLAPLDELGKISITLAANTDPTTTTPDGVVASYAVREEINGIEQFYTVRIPHNLGSLIDLATMAAPILEQTQTVSDSLGLLDPRTQVAPTQQTLTDAVGVADVVFSQLSAPTAFSQTVTDTVGLVDSRTPVFTGTRSQTDTLGLVDSRTQSLAAAPAAVAFSLMQETYHDGGSLMTQLTNAGINDSASFKAVLTSGEASYLAAHHGLFAYYCFPTELIRSVVNAGYTQTNDPSYASNMAGFVSAYGINDMYMRGMVEFDNDPANNSWAQNRFSEAGVGGSRPDIPTGLTRQQAYVQFMHYYQAVNHDGNTNHHQVGTWVNPVYTTRGYKTMLDPVNGAGCIYAYEMGADLVAVQTVNDDISGIIGKIAMVRGAGSQYSKPWGIDLSHSRSAAPLSGPLTYSGGTLTAGWSAPYMRRHCYITWLAGARVAASEAVELIAGAASGQTYNPTGLMYQAFEAFVAAHPDRGTAHVPFAIVRDHNGFWEPRYGQYNQGRAVWYFVMSANAAENMLFSLYDLIYPGANTSGSSTTTAEPMGTSRYGEAFDMLTDIATGTAYAKYRAVVWSSINTLTNAQVDALTTYVTAGGVVVLNAKQLAGTYHQNLTGITLGSTVTGASGTVTWDADSTTTTEPTFNYTTLGLTTATRAARLSTATNIVTKNVVGVGECWVVAADWMSRSDNTVVLGVTTKLLDVLAARFAPATVTGTAVEWLVNIGPTYTTVTVVNTATSSASVTVSWPLPGGTYTITEMFGNTNPTITVAGGRASISVTVSAGDVRMYRLQQT